MQHFYANERDKSIHKFRKNTVKTKEGTRIMCLCGKEHQRLSASHQELSKKRGIDPA